MKQPTIKVYDDYVFANDGVKTTVYSSLDHMQALAEMQPLALHAVFQAESSKAGTIEVQIQHSGDGLQFQAKNGASEIPAFTFNVTQLVSLAGAEVFTAPPSHEFVRIAMFLTGSGATAFGVLKVYATGQRRVSRQKHQMSGAAAGVHDAVRRHLPEQVARSIEAFRQRAGMSPETLGELRRLWRDGGGMASDAERADHVAFFLSPKARGEYARFVQESQKLSPHVKRTLKRAVATAALAEVTRPEWKFDDDEEIRS